MISTITRLFKKIYVDRFLHQTNGTNQLKRFIKIMPIITGNKLNSVIMKFTGPFCTNRVLRRNLDGRSQSSRFVEYDQRISK